MKALSIVVPVYNTELYLARCLDSMLYDENIFDDIEIIVVNDGSKDGSLAIAKQYEKQFSCVKIIDKKNGGHGSTINAALKIATGKYFRVVDSDDWLNMTDFPKYVKNLKKIDTDAVITDYQKEMTFGGEVVKFHFNKKMEFNKIYDLNKDADLFGNDYFHMAATAFKTELVKAAEFELDEKCFYVDMEFVVLPLKTINTFMRLDFNLYRYMIGRAEQSINMNSMFQRRSDHDRVLRRLLDFYKNNNFSTKKKKFIQNIISLMASTHYYIFLHPIATRKATAKELNKFDKFFKNNFYSIWFETVKHYPTVGYLDTKFFLAISILPRSLMKRMLARKVKEEEK